MASAGEGADRRRRTPDRYEPTRQRAFRARARPVLSRGHARRGRGRPAACARPPVGRALAGRRPARGRAPGLATCRCSGTRTRGKRSPRQGCAAPCTTGLADSGRRIPAGLGALPGCWLPGRCPAGPPSRPKSDARLLKDSDGLSSSPTMRTCVERPITSCSPQRECDKQREGT
jgi:hypothetical protein